jgi:hypothetical protein
LQKSFNVHRVQGLEEVVGHFSDLLLRDVLFLNGHLNRFLSGTSGKEEHDQQDEESGFHTSLPGMVVEGAAGSS